MQILVLRRNILFFYFLSACVLSQGADIYVSPTGTSEGNGTLGNPFQFIQEAIDHASSGDTVNLLSGSYSGTYNTMIVLPSSLNSLTLRGVDDDPGKTYVNWTEDSYQPFINTNTTTIALKVQGIGFINRRVTEDPNQPIIYPTFKISGPSSLVMENCRFFNTTSISPLSILYIYASTLASLTVRRTDFVNGVGNWGIQFDTGNMTIDQCNFAYHPGLSNGAGSCIYVRPITGPAVLNITSSNFINALAPVRILKGNATLFNNTFFNSTSSVVCNNVSKITASNNKFCGSSNGTCAAVPIGPIPVRPYDSCGVCDGNNFNKDCNGKCFGGARGSQCTPKKTIWVSTDGIGDGSSRDWPLGNISSAVSLAGYGDKVVLLGGNYTGEANLNIRIQGKTGFTITSENGNPDTDNVTIQCDGVTMSAFRISSGVSFDTVIEGVNIHRCGNISVNAVMLDATAGLTIRSVNFQYDGYSEAYGGGVYVDRGFVKLDDVIFRNSTAFAGIVYSYGGYVSSVNCKFIDNYVWDFGGSFFMESSILEVSNSYFVGADAWSKAGAWATLMSYVKATNNSFYNSGMTSLSLPRALYCASIQAGSGASGNVYCGSNTTVSASCTIMAPLSLSPSVDSCGVCNGDDSVKDCAGVCFGRDKSCL